MRPPATALFLRWGQGGVVDARSVAHLGIRSGEDASCRRIPMQRTSGTRVATRGCLSIRPWPTEEGRGVGKGINGTGGWYDQALAPVGRASPGLDRLSRQSERYRGWAGAMERGQGWNCPQECGRGRGFRNAWAGIQEWLWALESDVGHFGMDLSVPGASEFTREVGRWKAKREFPWG